MIERQAIIESMKKNAKENGFYICPDAKLFNDLIEGLATNITRYGYGSCPCRVASGVNCPCEYRDADINDFGMCYCGMFVNEKRKKNLSQMRSIPERRPQEIMDAALAATEIKQITSSESVIHTKSTENAPTIIVWRCTICGYLCGRELPPPICSICKAKSNRFEQFAFG